MAPASRAAATVWPDSAPDLGSRRLAAFGELSDFGGNDRKAFAMLARASGLNGGVQREKIGLAGNFLHESDLLGDGLHGLHRAVDGVPALLRVSAGSPRDFFRMGCIVGILLDVGSHLFHGRGDFLGRCRLLVGASRDFVACGRKFPAAGRDMTGRCQSVTDDDAELHAHAL